MINVLNIRKLCDIIYNQKKEEANSFSQNKIIKVSYNCKFT